MGVFSLTTSSLETCWDRDLWQGLFPWAHDWRDDDGWYVMNINLMLPSGVVLSSLVIPITKIYVEYSAYCRLSGYFQWCAGIVAVSFCVCGRDGCVSATCRTELCVLLAIAALDSLHIIIIAFILCFMLFPVKHSQFIFGRKETLIFYDKVISTTILTPNTNKWCTPGLQIVKFLILT